MSARPALAIASILFVLACSDSNGGGGGGAGGAGGAGGEPAARPKQSPASNRLFALLQGEADDADAEASDCVPRRMIGCVLDAPELGSRVLYLERSALETPDVPDRQLVVSLHGVDALWENQLQWVYSAQADVLTPTNGSLWIGLCNGDGVATPPEPLAASEACELDGGVSDTNFEGSLGGDNVDPACLGITTDAVSVTTAIGVGAQQNTWADFFSYADGTYDADPPCEDGGGACSTVQCPMTRRTPVPPIPEGDD